MLAAPKDKKLVAAKSCQHDETPLRRFYCNVCPVLNAEIAGVADYIAISLVDT